MPASDRPARSGRQPRTTLLMRVRSERLVTRLLLGLTVGPVMACSAGTPAGPIPATSTSSPSAAPSSASVSVPADGVTLATMGFQYGPTQSFSLPRTSVVTTRVDQPNAVTVVLSAPSPAEVARYLRTALPAAGFTVTGDDGRATLTFSGQGWTGDVTGTGSTSAVVLRPA